ncbi:MAG TPA: tetratricopeptide repeat protein [Anaerolineae bacterium]|nr:tetratricopeptide repeat protein [Anaerolineae bacterium]
MTPWLAPQPADREASRHNLPAPLTGMVGRQDELRLLQDWLLHERLVTLVGPGGCGKTRLALQVAWQSLPFFTDGVWLVSLASVTTPELCYFAISEALQLPAYSGLDPQKQIVNYLRGKHLLLVLDNFEQLLPVAGLVSTLLQQAPQVTALITSREKLSLYGECLFDLHGLSLPAAETLDALTASGAGQLFLQNARRARRDFALTAENYAAAIRICRLVEGMPLALELAGAWARALSCEQIAAHIASDLDFLTANWQDQPQRHRSLRTLLEHSWGMLTPQEQQTLRRLAVLAGPFDLPAAQAVAQVAPPLLAALVDKSLLHWNPATERYDSHPLLKRYAAARLAEDAVEQAEVNARHCRYFLEWIGRQQAALRGSQASQALHAIGAALNDIRQAWDWAVHNAQWELLDAGLEGLFRFYDTRSLYTEGADLFDGAAASLPQAAAPPDVLWRLRLHQAAFVARLRRLDEAHRLFEATLPALRDSDRPADLAFCLNRLGLLLALKGRHTEAAVALAEALTIARAQGLPLLEADVLINQAENEERQGRLVEAGAAIAPAGEIYRAQGDLRGEAYAYYLQGWVVVQQGHYLQAQACFRQSCAIGESLGDLFGQSSSLDALASALRRQGYYSDAAEHRRKALTLIQQTGSRQGEAVALSNLGTDLMNLGDYVAAQTFYQRSLAIYRELGFRRNESIDLGNLANLALNAGDPAAALDYLQPALEIAQAAGDQLMVGICQVMQADALAALARPAEAAARYTQVLPLLEELGQTGRALEARGGLAHVALVQGHRPAAQAQAEHIWQAVQAGREDAFDNVLDLYAACIRVFAAVGDARLPAAVQQAHALLQAHAAKIQDESLRRLFLENIPAHREILRAFAAPQPAAPPAAPSPLLDPLTRQEIEVLRLLAEGLSNRQIAEKLVITVGTVKSHVHAIYSKLNAQNRTQAVARGRELGWLKS